MGETPVERAKERLASAREDLDEADQELAHVLPPPAPPQAAGPPLDRAPSAIDISGGGGHPAGGTTDD